MAVSIEDIKKLKELTGVGLTDAKVALVEADGNFDKALEAMRKPAAITLQTDSRYLLDGITKWIHGWKKNGWRNAAREPVRNADLWMALDVAVKPHSIRWEWVRGHSGHPLNERADSLANEAIAAHFRQP